MDELIALALFGGICYYLLQRNLGHMIPWAVVFYFVAHKGAKLTHTVSMLVALAGLHLICLSTRFEGFEDGDGEKEKKKEKDPEPASAKTKDPHVDVGTTILHAYRNLTPEQLGGMRRDTRELMDLQKELMGSLTEMKPAIEQGAELLKTFGTFFGKPGGEGMLPPGLGAAMTA